MIRNPPYEFKDGIMLIDNQPFNRYIIVSKGQWFIKDSEVSLVCHIDGIINVMEGWVIKDYQVRKDEETCGINEFIFIDRITNEKYEFDPEPLGIFKGN
jgi:hypothetical protein